MDEPRPPIRRVEHRGPDGTARLLTESDLLTLAFAARDAWVRRLRRRGEAGDVLIVDQRTGREFAPRSVDPA